MVPKLGNAVDHLATSKVHLDSVYAGTAPAPTYILALAAAEAAVSTAQDMHAIRLLVEEKVRLPVPETVTSPIVPVDPTHPGVRRKDNQRMQRSENAHFCRPARTFADQRRGLRCWVLPIQSFVIRFPCVE